MAPHCRPPPLPVLSALSSDGGLGSGSGRMTNTNNTDACASGIVSIGVKGWGSADDRVTDDGGSGSGRCMMSMGARLKNLAGLGLVSSQLLCH